jgi:iron(III) transport system permease protein
MMKILRGLSTRHFFTKAIAAVALVLMVLLLIAPVVAVLLSWTSALSGALSGDLTSLAVLHSMAQTVLPSYARDTVILCVLVGISAGTIGTTSALLVTVFEFRGRAFFEWALLLPLAMPAYVVAYAYTDFLQFSGVLQSWLRISFGLEGRLLPEIRSLWGAAFVFSFCLYPYVYLLARTALSERAVHLMEAAKLLGSPLRSRLLRVAVPLARPAIAAGVALVLMETLADFGVVSYFGVQTFSAGVYKAWLAMDDRLAAAQLATILLLVVVIILRVEQHAQKRMRFMSSKGLNHSAKSALPLRLSGWHGRLAQMLCWMPILLGFIVPVSLMLITFTNQLQDHSAHYPWPSFITWSWNSLRLASLTALICVALGCWLSFAQRIKPAPSWVAKAVHIASLGYAVPGAVIVVGLLLPVAWLQGHFPALNVGFWLTASSFGLIWAYLVRFNAIAIHTIQSGYSRIPISLDESARMLGARQIGILQSLHAPLLKRSILTATLLIFVDVMKELPATLVLRPFNTDTLSVATYQLARDERLGEATLPALALVLVGLLPVILLSKTIQKKEG